MADCEGFRRTLGLLHDGEAPPGAEEARAHAAACPSCRDAAAVAASVAERLRERAGPAAAGDSVPGLRESLLARIRRGEAAVLELHPFLRRVAAAAAAVIVAATAAAFWQSSHRGPSPAVPDPSGAAAGITREELVAEMVRARLGIGR